MLRGIFGLVLLASFSAQAAIYGSDDRRDIYQVPWLAQQAKAVAISVPNLFLNKAADGSYSIAEVENLVDGVGMCSDERFAQQPSVGNCSGFLIGDRYLVTAGHCVLPNGVVDHQAHPFCEAFSWYFDFNEKREGQDLVTNIPASRIYGCKSIIRAENIALGPNLSGNDFALIELDRPVSEDIQPIAPAYEPMQPGDEVYTIGHPFGLPAKFSGMAPVLKLDQPWYFSANLDTEGGNSGSGVFNMRGEAVGILVSGFQVDYYTDPKGCIRFNRCDETGHNCNENSDLQYSNFVQNISTVLPYLPRLTAKR